MDRIDKKRVQVLAALEDLHDGRMSGPLTVDQAMSTDLSCIAPDTTVVQLVRMFHAKAFRHLLVTGTDGKLLGVISDRDVLRSLGPGHASQEELSRIVAGELMSTDLITVGPQTPLLKAIEILIDQGISCLPIVDDGRLVGILTNTDLHVVLLTLLQTVRLSGSADSVVSAS